MAAEFPINTLRKVHDWLASVVQLLQDKGNLDQRDFEELVQSLEAGRCEIAVALNILEDQ